VYRPVRLFLAHDCMEPRFRSESCAGTVPAQPLPLATGTG